MSKETIELLKILKDETHSRSVFDRCEAELASLKWTEPSPNAKAWNTTVAGRAFVEMDVKPGPWNFVTAEELEIYKRACADAYGIRDGEEVRIK